MPYQVLSRKWRPQSFDGVLSQQHVTESLQRMIASGRIHHGFVFSGIRGIGKTTTARILAKALNCAHGPTTTPCNHCEFCKEITDGSSMDVEEIDAASNRGVDDVRVLQDNVGYAPSRSRYKVFIIDEVHMLTTPAFNALLKTLEEPPSNVVFIMATTELWKVPMTILSRCQQYTFRNSTSEELQGLLATLAGREQIRISANSLALIAKTAGGSVRDAENLLDQVISFSGATIADRDVRYVLGIPEHALLHAILAALIDHRTTSVFTLMEQLVSHGCNFRLFCMELMERLRNLAVLKIAQNPDPYLVLFDYSRADLERYAAHATLSELQQWYWLIAQTERKIKYSPNPRYILELTLAHMTHVQALDTIEDLDARLTHMQAAIAAAASYATSPQSIGTPPPQVQEPSPIAPARQPVSAAPPSPEIAKMWAEVLNIIRAKRPSLSATLRQAIPAAFTDDTLTLGFHQDAEFSRNALNDPQRMADLQEVLQEYLGRPIKVQTTIHNDAVSTAVMQQRLSQAVPPRPAPVKTAPTAPPPATAKSPGAEKGNWKGRGKPQAQQYRPPTQVTVQDIVRLFDGQIEE